MIFYQLYRPGLLLPHQLHRLSTPRGVTIFYMPESIITSYYNNLTSPRRFISHLCNNRETGSNLFIGFGLIFCVQPKGSDRAEYPLKNKDITYPTP